MGWLIPSCVSVVRSSCCVADVWKATQWQQKWMYALAKKMDNGPLKVFPVAPESVPYQEISVM